MCRLRRARGWREMSTDLSCDLSETTLDNHSRDLSLVHTPHNSPPATITAATSTTSHGSRAEFSALTMSSCPITRTSIATIAEECENTPFRANEPVRVPTSALKVNDTTDHLRSLHLTLFIRDVALCDRKLHEAQRGARYAFKTAMSELEYVKQYCIVQF